MKNLILIPIALLSLFLSIKANAGLLLEPYMGYGATVLDADNGGSGTPVQWGASGTSVGARVGLTKLGFFLALDYEKGSRSFSVDDGTTTQVIDEKDITNTAVAIGWNPPIIPLRVWGKKIISTKLEDDDETWKGDGIGLGVGLTILPIIDINVEYKTYDIDEVSSGVVVTEGKEVFVGISAPFDL